MKIDTPYEPRDIIRYVEGFGGDEKVNEFEVIRVEASIFGRGPTIDYSIKFVPAKVKGRSSYDFRERSAGPHAIELVKRACQHENEDGVNFRDEAVQRIVKNVDLGTLLINVAVKCPLCEEWIL